MLYFNHLQHAWHTNGSGLNHSSRERGSFWRRCGWSNSFGIPRPFFFFAIEHSYPVQLIPSISIGAIDAYRRRIAHIDTLFFARHHRLLRADINRLFPIECQQLHGHFRLQHAVCSPDNLDCD